MAIVLTDVEARVLGALVEKDITTPDYYPLSLNALVNACNQKNNRDPVMTLDENQVREALSGLEAMGLAGPASSADSRVTKYEHHLQDVFNFSRGETAVICVLLLRGPQTPGELRGRTERLHRFEDLEAVQAALQHLMRREPPLAVMLPRQPGTKESRYAHLLSGEIPVAAPASRGVAVPVDPPQQDRVSRLEEQVATLEREVSDLKQTVEALRKRFE
ncbi:MAG TPA: YceH family protein [Terriglobales bacterium]